MKDNNFLLIDIIYKEFLQKLQNDKDNFEQLYQNLYFELEMKGVSAQQYKEYLDVRDNILTDLSDFENNEDL